MDILCAKGYEFNILDSAFLVHKPGIKRPKYQPWRSKYVSSQNYMIRTKIRPELRALYGDGSQGCIWLPKNVKANVITKKKI